MTKARFTSKPPLGYRRSYRLSRSEKVFVAAIILLFLGLSNVIITILSLSDAHDMLGLRAAQSSAFALFIHSLNQSYFFRLALGFTILGLILLPIGFITRQDENNGKIAIPSRFVKKERGR